MSRAGALVGAARDLRAAARSAGAWSAAERRAVLGALETVTALMMGTRSDLLASEEASGTWLAPGVPSLGARVGRDTGIGRGAGMARVRQGETWAEVPVLAEAAEAGEITAGHVDAVGRVSRVAEPHVRAALTSPETQGRLLALARRLDAPAFAKEVARAAASLDPTAPDRAHERQRERRFLTLVDTPLGTELTGLLDHQGGRRLRLALEAAMSRPGLDDLRTAGQRRADALVDLADASLSRPETGSGAAVRPHVSLVMSVDTLARIRTAQGRRVADRGPGSDPGSAVAVRGVGHGAGADGAGVGEAQAVPGDRCLVTRPLVFDTVVDPVTDEDGVVVPLAEVARILCDCVVTRIALDAAGEPLDLGRQARLYTGAQRRAVLARDRGCAWEGCSAPARWCEIHHIEWWDRDNGRTSVSNGVALCRHHHHEVHRLDLHLERHAVDLPRVVGRDGANGSSAPPDGGPAPFDPGRAQVRYVIRSRDGAVVAGNGSPWRLDPAAAGPEIALGA